MLCRRLKAFLELISRWYNFFFLHQVDLIQTLTGMLVTVSDPLHLSVWLDSAMDKYVAGLFDITNKLKKNQKPA